MKNEHCRVLPKNFSNAHLLFFDSTPHGSWWATLSLNMGHSIKSTGSLVVWLLSHSFCLWIWYSFSLMNGWASAFVTFIKAHLDSSPQPCVPVLDRSSRISFWITESWFWSTRYFLILDCCNCSYTSPFKLPRSMHLDLGQSVSHLVLDRPNCISPSRLAASRFWVVTSRLAPRFQSPPPHISFEFSRSSFWIATVSHLVLKLPDWLSITVSRLGSSRRLASRFWIETVSHILFEFAASLWIEATRF
jgi:hypothetical protein